MDRTSVGTRLAAIALATCGSLGCAGSKASTALKSGPATEASSPEADTRPILEETKLGSGDALWIYTPPDSGAAAKGIVLIAPAGSNLVTGMALSEGDRPEHVPYVEAGYIVFAYALGGALEESSDEAAMMTALRTFRETEAGLVTARSALDEAQARYPKLVSKGVFIAGHSSAGTHALYVASQEPRIRAVAAYAPAIDVPAHVGADFVAALEQLSEGHAEFLSRISPIERVTELAAKPVFLFSAKDDQIVGGQPSQLAKALREAGADASLEHVVAETGGHYDSMLDVGIPAAMAWFESLTP